MLIYLILAVPAAAGAAAAVTPWRRQLSWLAAAANGAVLVMGSVLAVRVTRHPPLAARAACSARTRSAPSWSW